MSAAHDTDGEPSGEGIFGGTKFWLSQRVPSRIHIISLIKKHGGVQVPYDIKADILIADHARPDAPPNSFSWRLVTESVEAGRFVDKEPHRIGRLPTEPRPVGSKEPAKSSRTPFSAADDALLAAWVSESKHKSGNKIYQELEAEHPNHTWHSWRDRWVKHLRNLPADTLEEMVASGLSKREAPAAAAPAPSAPKGKASTTTARAPSASKGKTSTAAAPASRASKEKASTATDPAPSASKGKESAATAPAPSASKRKASTAEAPAPSALKGTASTVKTHVPRASKGKASASTAPVSSASKGKTSTAEASAPSASKGKAPTSAAATRPRPQQQTSPMRTQQPPPVQTPPRPLSPSEREESPSFNDEDDDLIEKWVKSMVEDGKRWNDIGIYEALAEVASKESSSRHSAQSWKQRFRTLWRENRISTKDWNSNNQPDSRSSTGDGLRARNGDTSPTGENESPERDAMAFSQESLPEDDDTPKTSFYNHYSMWINWKAQHGETKEVVMFHHIQGRKFELWDLYEVVLGQGGAINDLDWKVVAEKMGYEAESLFHASEELEGCWDVYLCNFHEHMYDALADDSSASEESGDDDSGGEDIQIFEGQDISGGQGISGGQDASGDEGIPGGEDAFEDEDAPTLRRSHPSPILSARPSSSHRKRRLDRDAEIPASPQALVRPGSRHAAGNTAPQKRRRLFEGFPDGRRADTDTDEENIYEATPPRKPSARLIIPPSSPLPVRSGGPHRSATPGSSTAGERTRRANETTGSSTAGEHTRRASTAPKSKTPREQARPANATSGSSAARERKRRTESIPRSSAPREPAKRANGARVRTSSPEGAPKRRSLPSAIDPKPKPKPHPIIDDDHDGGEEDPDDDWAAVQQLVREGYSHAVAANGLYRTSFICALARTVCASIKRGDEVPDNLRGVWTAGDDEKLKRVDAVDMNQPTGNIVERRKKEQLLGILKGLLRKHGEGNIEKRRVFLADVEKEGVSLE